MKALSENNFLFTFLLSIALALSSLSCASQRPQYVDQIYEFIVDLSNTQPADAEEIFDFAVRHSHQLNMSIPGIGDEIVKMLDRPGPWFEKILLAYLLAWREDPEGFAAMIRLLDRDLPFEVREGLQYCVLKYLGMTERDKPFPGAGIEADLKEWKEYLKSIRRIGVRGWRREYIQNLVLSGGEGGIGEASAWLSYSLRVRDVPFLSDLLGKGSPMCDHALLVIIENLLMRDFIHEEGDEAFDTGLRVFRQWFEENRSRSPDQWITESFKEAGFKDIEDLYNQSALQKILDGLMDESERWVLVRGHTLAALNRICGYNVDRQVIFLDEGHRKVVREAFRQWYLDLAELFKTE